MKNIRAISVVVLLLLSGIIIPIVLSNEISTNKTIYVDDDNTNGPWDGSLEHPYQLIQDGIDVSVDGDSIYVFNGTYREILSISRSIALQGENPQITIIDGMVDGNAINIFSDYVRINGFTITNTTYPPYETYQGIFLSNVNHCTISENIIFSTENGIALTNSSDTTITGNIMRNNNLGILLSGSSDNTITRNTIFDNGCGIFLWSSLYTMIASNIIMDNGAGIFLRGVSSHNMIIENTIADNLGIGIKLELDSSDNTIAGNTIGNNSLGGIWLYTSNTNISDNIFYSNGITFWGSTEEEWVSHTIENNVANDKPIRYYKNMHHVNVPSDTAQVILANCNNCTIENLNLSTVNAGIQLGFSADATITANTITDNNNGAIMLTSSSDSMIEGNIINNNFFGITLSYSSDIIIADNTITDSHGEGIYLYYSSDTMITGNNIGNNFYGLFLAYSSKNMITNNIITDNNATGISLEQECSDNIIRLNNIEGNKEYGISIYDAEYNNITANNFIINGVHATFPWLHFTVWSGNYWDDWIGLQYPILSFLPYHIDRLSFDWHPAKEPYDIPSSEVVMV